MSSHHKPFFCLRLPPSATNMETNISFSCLNALVYSSSTPLPPPVITGFPIITYIHITFSMIINPHTHTMAVTYLHIHSYRKNQNHSLEEEILKSSIFHQGEKKFKKCQNLFKRSFLELLREFIDLGVSLVVAQNRVRDFKKFSRTLGGRKRARTAPTKSVRLEEITSLLTTSKNLSEMITCRSSENISPKRSI